MVCKFTKKGNHQSSLAGVLKAAYLTHMAKIKHALAVGWNHTMFSSKYSSGGALHSCFAGLHVII